MKISQKIVAELELQFKHKGKLLKVERDLLQFLVNKYGDSNKPAEYRNQGDLIIAIECPKQQILLAKDKLFKTLTNLMSKRFQIWPTKDSKTVNTS